MTTIKTALAHAITAAKKAKERRVRRSGFTDMTATIMTYRGQELVAVVTPNRIERDLTLTGARIAASGFNADLLAIVMETWHTTTRTHPLTGKEWGNGDMQDLAENHRGVEQGWVTDALTVTAYNRAGDSAIRLLPYRVQRKQVLWLAERGSTDVESGPADGYVHQFLLDTMSRPSMEVEMERLGFAAREFGFGPEEAVAHQDCATAKALMHPPVGDGRFMVGLCAEPGTVRFDVITESMPDADIVRPERGWQN